MPNNSSTGGYLQPGPTPAPLEGQALLRFFQQIIVGITGLDGTLVRPYWQAEPPNIPEEGDAWASFRITRRPADEFPFIGRLPYQSVDDGNDHLQRHEQLEILTSFYDLGSTGENNSGGLADAYAALFRDGLAVPQNREPLFLAGMGIATIGSEVTVPVLFKRRWKYQVDFDWSVRRQIDRVYPVNTIVSASGNIYTDGGYPPQSFSAT